MQPAPPPRTKEEAEAAQRELVAKLTVERRKEDVLLAQASKIKEVLGALKVTPHPEPKKQKSHWDHVLEEMVWLAKEFQKERIWKHRKAKQYVGAVQRSNKDLESRVAVRAQEEEKAIRKRAQWIAKEVASFWSKAHRVVLYKVKSQVEAKKKEVMDKQLDALLGQTQRYSAILAQRLAEDDAVKQEQLPCLLQPITEEASSPVREMSSRAGRRRIPATASAPGSAAVSADTGADESLDYRSGEDSADDEATLEEEEHLAQLEGTNDTDLLEVAALTDEAELPLEQLLAKFGGYRPGILGASDDEAGPSTARSDDGTASLLQGMVESPAFPPSEEEEEEDQESSIDYHSGEDSSDDEATLEEEEVLAKREGRDKEEKEEATALEQDLDVPLDQLLPPEMLARYGASLKSPASAIVKKTEGTAEVADVVQFASAAETMAQLQPTGFTLATSSTRVTEQPFLLKGQLREYQQIGLDWLVTLYHKRLNGILADEMGLGKTIQTIAMLAHLACEHGDWGPHLVVVPTSVMLNWEMEFKKWCPAFKLLTYYGGVKERAAKRQGWSKPNAFHVCITSYTLVLQDSRVFKRKKWKYLILDEAHMIKNWRSQRWQTLLGFNSKRRLLITGTPLQNDLMELWSLMHFLMPQVFASHAQFKDWFSNPLTGMVEGSADYNRAVVERLHAVLRPFLLRRLKKDVEKQLPPKHEHVVYCKLSKRQRQLYEEYMASSDTRAIMSSGNFLGIVNCLMQLRKVCNHPDLFEARPIVSAFDMPALNVRMPSATVGLLERGSYLRDRPHLDNLGLMFSPNEIFSCPVADDIKTLAYPPQTFAQPATQPHEDVELLMRGADGSLLTGLPFKPSNAAVQAVIDAVQALAFKRRMWRAERTATLGKLNCIRTAVSPCFGEDLRNAVRVLSPAKDVHIIKRATRDVFCYSNALLNAVKLPEERAAATQDIMQRFCCYIPNARAAPAAVVCSHPDASLSTRMSVISEEMRREYLSRSALLHTPRLHTQLFFPDRRLIQYDCGKLQELAILLRNLKSGGHRALLFTQMSKMLDVLEVFLNIHGYTYVRLDGATKPETRQILMQRFNADNKIFCFILSTRSGGVGMNLTGADSVIFYDSDWNPAMDAQAQDRCHRIGQTREVHIYRLVSKHTVEENILKKSDQKRYLDFLAIQSGGFNTEVLTKFDPKALLGIPSAEEEVQVGPSTAITPSKAGEPTAAQIMEAMRAAEDEGDAAAAAAAEEEVAQEMDEFIKEPPPGPPEADAESQGEGKENDVSCGANGEPSAAAAAAQTEGFTPATDVVEDELIADVVALAGGAEGADALEHLEKALQPIERYAVQYLESENPQVDPTALAAQIEATYAVEEFDIDAIEAQEEEREADIDDDEDANVVNEWDRQAATAAYLEQVERAKREEEEKQQAYEAWLAQYGLTVEEAAAAEAAAATAAVGRGRPKSWGVAPAGAPVPHEDFDTALSPRNDGGLREVKRRRLDSKVLPWEPLEDFVLTSVVAMLAERGQPVSAASYTVASDVLIGGGASSYTSLDDGLRQGRHRDVDACRKRYEQLCTAYAASIRSPNTLQITVDELRSQLEEFLVAEDSRAAVTIAHHNLATEVRAVETATRLIELLQQLRRGMTIKREMSCVLNSAASVDPTVLVPAVRAKCGAGAARVIGSRLPGLVTSAMVEKKQLEGNDADGGRYDTLDKMLTST